ncbi:MAG TPA: hypothetical protein VK535_10280, partial [Gemmatimonadales bacterium]|nr:hypothetical protein [Gemmatimonadales bacterium]
MSEDEDLDLQALQRQLDDAFQTTRPRPAFEDELWLRMQARRPIWLRLRDGFSGLIAGLREAPAVPSAAVAILLIVVVGAGIVSLSGLQLSGGGATSGLTARSQDAAGAAPEYGPLPAPSFGVVAGPASTPVDGATYFGPVTLVWDGRLEVTPTSLPVFRYKEPTQADADQFAASVGAGSAAKSVTGALGSYSSENRVDLVVYGSVAQPTREPTFVLSETRTALVPEGDPVSEATAYLAAHSLSPSWPYQTVVQNAGTTIRVKFVRAFDVPNHGLVNLVDGAGAGYGIEVDFVAGQPRVLETGPLPLSLDSAAYPVISSERALQSALATSATSAGSTPYPVVRLT